MQKYHIQLTNEEKQVVESIDFGVVHGNHDERHSAYKANKELILDLLKRLVDRRAIPQERIKYWRDPSYNSGKMRLSRKEVFEGNGCTGDDIYTHPHFIPVLRYFLFGSVLTDSIIEKFEKKVGNPDWITSSDIVPIGKYAQDLARTYELDRNHASEEFFKLCLDMGLDLDTAQSVRQAVMKLR